MSLEYHPGEYEVDFGRPYGFSPNDSYPLPVIDAEFIYCYNCHRHFIIKKRQKIYDKIREIKRLQDSITPPPKKSFLDRIKQRFL